MTRREERKGNNWLPLPVISIKFRDHLRKVMGEAGN
jgi:hypothetical protein